MHYLASLLVKMEDKLNSPRGRFPSERFLSKVTRLVLIII